MMDLPAPLTPADCDLRDFAFLPLDVVRLRDSDLAIHVTGEEFRCAVLLWCASWHQVPAASLPDDDKTLAALAGFGRAVGEWAKHRDGALRGWVKCSDGRLYHSVIAEKAREAWASKHEYAHRKLLDRLRKSGVQKEDMPTLDEWLSAGKPKTWPTDSNGKNGNSSGNQNDSSGKDGSSGGNDPDSDDHSAGNPPENVLKGQGQGYIKTNTPPNPQGGESPPKPKRERKPRIQLKTFIDQCVQAGEKPISGYQPLLTYVESTGLPMEFVQIAWDVFKREFLPDGTHESRLQADWRRHFLNYVEKGYYRLWFAKQTDAGPVYELSTQGIQAQASLRKEAA